MSACRSKASNGHIVSYRSATAATQLYHNKATASNGDVAQTLLYFTDNNIICVTLALLNNEIFETTSVNPLPT